MIFNAPLPGHFPASLLGCSQKPRAIDIWSGTVIRVREFRPFRPSSHHKLCEGTDDNVCPFVNSLWKLLQIELQSHAVAVGSDSNGDIDALDKTAHVYRTGARGHGGARHRVDGYFTVGGH